MHKNFKELKELYELRDFAYKDFIRTQILDEVTYQGETYPIVSFEIGSKDKTAPTLGLFGGVHGLEKVGTHFVISYLASLLKQLHWDNDLRFQLKTSRIVSIPLINPVGMAHHTRCNGNGVDLMRNAPVDAIGDNLPFLIAGHRFSNKLPWYRGEIGEPMQQESQILVDYCKRELFKSELAITIDFHSGFGIRDRLWYPYAKQIGNFPSEGEVKKLIDLIEDSLTHHIYKIEPQSEVYTTHGDLWDYIYDAHREETQGKKLFLPWTLEMGSWTWVKKNPLQLFSWHGLFNPIKRHRHERVMRRHKALVDLLFRASRNQKWLT